MKGGKEEMRLVAQGCHVLWYGLLDSQSFV